MNIREKGIGLSRDMRFRYLGVAILNTVVGYSVYGVLLVSFGDSLYLWALLGSHLIATTIAFALYRRCVFLVRGSHWLDYARFQAVYLVSLALNAILLSLIVSATSVEPLFAQFICVFVVAIVSFFGHRHFSFRRSRTVK